MTKKIQMETIFNVYRTMPDGSLKYVIGFREKSNAILEVQCRSTEDCVWLWKEERRPK